MSNPKRLAFISGSAQRVGRKVALHLAQQGWDLALHYNTSEDAAQSLKRQVEELGAKADLYKANLSETEKLTALVKDVIAHSGEPQLVLNNASIFLRDKAGETDIRFFNDQMNMNALHPIIISEAFATNTTSDMVIINMLDQKITNFSIDYISYTLSKVALATATKIHAFSLRPGVRVNGIALGMILPSGGQTEEEFAVKSKQNPLNVTPSLDEVMRAVDLFCNTRSITATIIYIDGGRHLISTYTDDDMGVFDRGY